jgi:hypothetical protein
VCVCVCVCVKERERERGRERESYQLVVELNDLRMCNLHSHQQCWKVSTSLGPHIYGRCHFSRPLPS